MVVASGGGTQPNPPGVATIERPPEQHHVGPSAMAEYPARQGHPSPVCQRVDNHSNRRQQQRVVPLVDRSLRDQRAARSAATFQSQMNCNKGKR